MIDVGSSSVRDLYHIAAIRSFPSYMMLSKMVRSSGRDRSQRWKGTQSERRSEVVRFRLTAQPTWQTSANFGVDANDRSTPVLRVQLALLRANMECTYSPYFSSLCRVNAVFFCFITSSKTSQTVRSAIFFHLVERDACTRYHVQLEQLR